MRRRILLLTSLLFLILAPAHLDAVDTGKPLIITFLDVGQGDCSFIRTPAGRTILIDGGGRSDSGDGASVGEKVVLPYLRHEGVSKLDIVLLTHPHDDHLQGLLPVLSTMRVGRFLDSGISSSSESYARYLRIIKKRGIPRTRVFRGQRIDLKDGASIAILNPPARRSGAPSANLNDDSIVLKLDCYKRGFLFTGDAGFDAEDSIMGAGLDVRADIIKIGHHGSRFSTSSAFLNACKPKAAVISAGRGNPFGHPARETLDKLRKHRVVVYRTDTSGAIMVRCDSKGVITLKTTRQIGKRPTNRRRPAAGLPR